MAGPRGDIAVKEFVSENPPPLAMARTCPPTAWAASSSPTAAAGPAARQPATRPVPPSRAARNSPRLSLGVSAAACLSILGSLHGGRFAIIAGGADAQAIVSALTGLERLRGLVPRPYGLGYRCFDPDGPRPAERGLVEPRRGD